METSLSSTMVPSWGHFMDIISETSFAKGSESGGARSLHSSGIPETQPARTSTSNFAGEAGLSIPSWCCLDSPDPDDNEPQGVKW